MAVEDGPGPDLPAATRCRELRLVSGDAPRALSGEDVLREGARMLGGYLTRQLEVLADDDPDFALIEAEACRFLRLADWRTPRKPRGPRA